MAVASRLRALSPVSIRSGHAGRASARTRIRRSSPGLVVGICLLTFLVMAALFAPLLAPAPPELMQPALRLQAPSFQHPFGTDQFGRDQFSRVLFGAQLALKVSILTVLLSAIPGIVLGLGAGYSRHWSGQSLARFMDAWLAFPGLLLAVALVARLGPSLNAAIIALGIIGVPSFFRMARSSALSASREPYIESAQAIGAPHSRILHRHILPNIASPLVVLITLRLGTVLLAAGGLSFIGLGAQPPTPEWGAMLATGRDYMGTAWWLALFPGLAITFSVIGFNLLGDGLRDILAPRR